MINKIFKYFNPNTLRILCCTLLICLFCGCDASEDMAEGKDQNYNQQAECWQANIVGVVLENLESNFDVSAKKVVGAHSGLSLILIAFSVWMAFKLLKILSSYKEESIGEVWTEIFHKGFLCGFCALIVLNLGNIQWAMNLFVVPLYNTLIELGSEVIGRKPLLSSISLGDFGEVQFVAQYSSCSAASLDASNVSNSIRPMIECMTCKISDRLNSGFRISFALFEFGLKGILAGLTMMALFFAAKIFFVLFLIDSIFRLYFAMYLLPVLIVGVPFNYTRKWSKHGLLMFLNSAGIMLFMGILISIAVGSLETILLSFQRSNYFDEAHMSGQGPMFLSMLLISTLLINIPALGVSLADKFIGGGGSLAFQEKVSKFVIDSAKKAGSAILGGITAGATSPVTTFAEKYELSRRAMNRVKQVKQNLKSAAGYNDD